MTSSVFKKSIFISLLGHLTVFSIFSLSFSNNIPKLHYVSVSFWGQFLHNSQVSQPITTALMLHKNEFFSIRNTTQINNNVIVSNGIKPLLTLAFHSEKEIFIQKPPTQLVTSTKPKPSIIFHPLLPYSFALYFKDRQIAHVELMYKIISQGERNSILLKRKVSSGNLEVDLLTMRYIGRYLFMREASLIANNWQTVKIDLSAKK